ncbi:MAG: anaerobic ribonucleoside-triphosphate reductase activating protein [Candidatus Paceibacterota bacterium]|jgi:pyruvate formate lyase activating enzyme
MKIGGFQKFSLIDYPKKSSAIIFTQGCSFRCDYCHNPELLNPLLFQDLIPEEEILEFLEKRKDKLDAVVVSGGEPFVQPDLESFLKKIKALGYLIKLDTNGSFPDRLEKVIEEKLVDYIAMDIKGPFEKYHQISNSKIDLGKIKKSIKLITNSGIDYEFRTTIVRSQLSENDFVKIGEMIKGAKLYALQKFIPTKTLNPEFLKEVSYSDEELEKTRQNLIELFGINCIIR